MVQTADEAVKLELFAKFFHGLSNGTRLRLVEILLEGERTVGELVDLVGVTQGQVSNHLACLRWCGYVSSRQDGRYVLYRISDERVRTIVELAKAVVADNAQHISTCARM